MKGNAWDHVISFFIPMFRSIMSLQKQLIAIAVMAIVTYIPRALPITIFRKEIKSVFIKSFLQYVPYAVIGALTFPEVFTSTGNILTASMGVVVAGVLAFYEKSLVIVAIGAVLTVYIAQLLINVIC